MFLRKGLMVAAFAGAVACSYWYVYNTDEWLSNLSDEARAEALVLKTEFQEADVRPQRAVENHTHGASAASRSTATFLIQRIASGGGRKAFFIQGSGADFRAGRLHSREYYWLKDVMCPATRATPGPRDVLGLVDVDYYFDMKDLLTKRFQPYLLYTFVPSRAAKGEGEYKYRFLADQSVEYSVAGGGLYPHELWNWDGDSIRVVKRWFGIPVGYVGYAIERRQMDPDHQLVLLVPLVQTGFWSSWVAAWKLAAAEVRRFQPVVDGFVRFYVNTKEAMKVATGKAGGYSDCMTLASVDDAIASTARTVSGKLTLMSVKSKMDDGADSNVKNYKGAEVLLEFHLARLPTRERMSLLEAVRRFQWVPKGAEPDADAKPGMVAFMGPLLHGGFVPDVCRGNEERFVEERVRKLAKPDTELDPFTLRVMEEFAEHLVPVPHLLSPVDHEEVYARQSSPSQRAILHEAEHGKPTRVTKQFIKREAYGRVNDPRGISTINGVDKMEYSRYIYAYVDEVLRPQPWCAIGKSNAEIAERVAGISTGAEYGDNTDYERQDGNKDNRPRVLDRIVMTRAFHPKYHAEMLEQMRRQYNLTGKTTFGVVYQTGMAQASGSADTAASNTTLNAFIAYLTYRRQYMSKEDAWAMLGIFLGDDGYSTGMSKRVAAECAARMGQVLDLERTYRGNVGVSFLARRYGPDVWYGDTNSCCDIKRQLAKFHLTVNLPANISPVQKLREKAYAFSLSDSNTPVIGEFVRTVLALFPLNPADFRNDLGIWGVEMDASRQYPNEYADWMEDIARSELADFDLDRFRGWLEGVNGATIFNPPRFADPLPADPKPGVVAVDGDLLVNEGSPEGRGGDEQSSDEADGKPHFRPRKPKARPPKAKVKEGKPPLNPPVEPKPKL
uniref:RNA replicase n=1 Tax=Hubei noda-like virus 2 TaxID=1922975 RepID=A0A1L3KGN0_9VIRU|nr:hypothetical protein [Hubei noda-like virus 2]